MSDDEEPADQTSIGGYEVGYRKPPRHTRFKPGQSGNPRGRPKDANNLKTDLMEELGEKIVIREGDQTHRVSKQRAVVKSIVARSLKGNARVDALLISMMLRLLDTGEGAAAVEEALLDDEHEILQAFVDRVRRGGDHQPAPQVDSNDDAEDPS